MLIEKILRVVNKLPFLIGKGERMRLSDICDFEYKGRLYYPMWLDDGDRYAIIYQPSPEYYGVGDEDVVCFVNGDTEYEETIKMIDESKYNYSILDEQVDKEKYKELMLAAHNLCNGDCPNCMYNCCPRDEFIKLLDNIKAYPLG